MISVYERLARRGYDCTVNGVLCKIVVAMENDGVLCRVKVPCRLQMSKKRLAQVAGKLKLNNDPEEV